MKILSPLSRPEEVEDLVHEGADEFYCGILPQEWEKRYTAASINRRWTREASLRSFSELALSVRRAHAQGRTVYLTLNQLYYSPEQYPLLLRYVARSLNAGVDGFIVGSLDLLLTLREREPDVALIVSTTGTAFNSEAVNFYRDLGARRVILPRHLTLAEIKAIRRRTAGVELEAFILNSRCPNVEGYCMTLHGLPPEEGCPSTARNACLLPYDITLAEGDAESEALVERQKVWERVEMDSLPCGVCALYELRGLVDGVKIVGRDNPSWKKIMDVAFIRSLRDYLERERPTRERFLYTAQRLYSSYKHLLASMHPHNLGVVKALTHGCDFQNPCRPYTCYYPSPLRR